MSNDYSRDVSASADGNETCAECGQQFACGMVAGSSACWCADLPTLAAANPRAAGCYCPACLRAKLAEQAAQAQQQ